MTWIFHYNVFISIEKYLQLLYREVMPRMRNAVHHAAVKHGIEILRLYIYYGNPYTFFQCPSVVHITGILIVPNFPLVLLRCLAHCVCCMLRHFAATCRNMCGRFQETYSLLTHCLAGINSPNSPMPAMSKTLLA